MLQLPSFVHFYYPLVGGSDLQAKPEEIGEMEEVEEEREEEEEEVKESSDEHYSR